ncbi:MAG: ABC transporter ATP-binding protein [Bacteroidales bacterium]|jgi:ATP-binding cassette subfamily C protein|nr:ABC transporter ATP-binding protein [Bacteroidales bacterium]
MHLPPEYQKLRRLFSRNDKIKLVILFGLMMIAAVLEVIGIGIIPAFVAVVANPQKVMEHKYVGSVVKYLNIKNPRELLIFMSIGLISIFLIKNTYTLFFRYVEAKFIYNRRYSFSHKLMTAYMHAPYTFYLERNTTELLRNTTNEVDLMINSVMRPTMIILKELIMGTSVIVFLVLIEPLITLIVAVVLGGLAGIFLFMTQNRMKTIGREAQRYRREMLRAARQGFGGIKDARVLNRENEFIEIFRSMARKSSRLQQNRVFISMIPKPMIETLAVSGVILIALLMVLQGRPIENVVPILTLFAVAIIRLMPAIQQITQTLTDIRYHLPSVNAVYDDLMYLRPFNKQFEKDRRKKDKLELKNNITINNIFYQYSNSSEQAINGISLTIPHGKAIAFVGASGAGKTTIVDVLLGLLEPQQGEILVDGKNIYESISAWQRNIGYIPQFIYLGDESLRRNIAFGLSDKIIDEEEVLRTVKLAQLEELVAQLPEGLDTRVGERGTRLSGGQRQRVGIARALYNNPQVLVMDEATSALDNITEQQIIDSIENLKGERTVIMIAHRLTTVMNCDMLYFMDKGKIIDQGTYQELLERNKLFREMAKERSDKPKPVSDLNKSQDNASFHNDPDEIFSVK